MSSKESKREFTARRRMFEKESLRFTNSKLKKQGWKKIQNIFFRSESDWFWSITINTYLNDEKTILSLEAKPMGVDPYLWEILAIPENHHAPLSFRANGAFTCSALSVAELAVGDKGKSAESISQIIEDWLLGKFDEYTLRVTSRSFSSQLEEHDNQVQRGAYAIALVTSLIAEGKFDRAKCYSRKYESGELESVFGMNSLGKSFYFHALQWLRMNHASS